MERTVVLVKPDGLQRGLIGEIMTRFENKGLKLLGLKMVKLDEDILKQWYEEYKDAEFFPVITGYMTWTPVVAMVWEGKSAVEVGRRIVGTRKGYEAEAGSVRGDYSLSGGHNLIHASDSVKNGKKEQMLLFGKGEIHEYESVVDQLLYSEDERKGVFR